MSPLACLLYCLASSMGEQTNVEMSKQFVCKKPSLAAFPMSLNNTRFQTAGFVCLVSSGNETANTVKNCALCISLISHYSNCKTEEIKNSAGSTLCSVYAGSNNRK